MKFDADALMHKKAAIEEQREAMRRAEAEHAARTPTFEDVRLMIREEIRAALREMWRTGTDGSHQMAISRDYSEAVANTRVNERAYEQATHAHTGTPRGPSLWGA